MKAPFNPKFRRPSSESAFAAAPPGSICATVAVLSNSRAVSQRLRSTVASRSPASTLSPPPNPTMPIHRPKRTRSSTVGCGRTALRSQVVPGTSVSMPANLRVRGRLVQQATEKGSPDRGCVTRGLVNVVGRSTLTGVVVPHWPDPAAWNDAALGRALAPPMPQKLGAARPERIERLRPIHGACPEALPTLARSAEGPLLVGAGSLRYLCWQCDRVLCDGTHPGDLAGLILRCRCGAVGRVEAILSTGFEREQRPFPWTLPRPPLPRMEPVARVSASPLPADAAAPASDMSKPPPRGEQPPSVNPGRAQVMPVPRLTPDVFGDWEARLATGDASVAQVLAPCLLAEVAQLSTELARAERQLARLAAVASAGDQARDELAQRLGIDGLRQGRAGVPLQKRKRSRRERSAGDERDASGELRPRQLDLLEELDPVQLGHLQVEEHGVPALTRLDSTQGLGGGDQGGHVVVPLEQPPVCPHEDLLVVDDEHAAAR